MSTPEIATLAEQIAGLVDDEVQAHEIYTNLMLSRLLPQFGNMQGTAIDGGRLDDSIANLAEIRVGETYRTKPQLFLWQSAEMHEAERLRSALEQRRDEMRAVDAWHELGPELKELCNVIPDAQLQFLGLSIMRAIGRLRVEMTLHINIRAISISDPDVAREVYLESHKTAERTKSLLGVIRALALRAQEDEHEGVQKLAQYIDTKLHELIEEYRGKDAELAYCLTGYLQLQSLDRA